MNFLLIDKEKLDIAVINELVSDETCGAISLFVGTTRNNFESKKVACLEYEAYEPMAIKQMETICEEVRNRWSDVHNIAMHHRIGDVPVREASVVIAISSPHRQSSLNAVAFCIEELKRRVPIWKKEIYIDDESTWKENKEFVETNCSFEDFLSYLSTVGTTCKFTSFDHEKCSIQQFTPVPSKLVQICVEEQEINRRIFRFVEKKREENDFNNILDFTGKGHEEEVDNVADELSACARTDSVVVKQESSKCHLRVKRAVNRIGPQTKNSYLHTLDKLMSNIDKPECIKNQTTCIHKTMLTQTYRMATIEKHLEISNNESKNIFERLRNIENRILFLESISPEYNHFFEDYVAVDCKRFRKSPNTSNYTKQVVYSVQDLDSIINQINKSN